MERFVAAVLLAAACTAAPPPTRPPRLFRVVVIGDSVAHGAGDERGRGIARDLADDLHASASNLGVNGARTGTVIRLLRDARTRAALATADLIVVSIGGNDLYGDATARLLTTLWPSHAMERTLDRIALIVRDLRHLNRGARIALLGLYDPYRTPSLDRAVNEWDARLIARFAAERDVDVVRIDDLFRTQRLSPIDHFHPSADAYARIARRIAESQ